MNVLTSPTFWIIIGAIILIMALIGYLAEGTDLANKALSKKPKENKGKEEPKTTVEEVVPIATAGISPSAIPGQEQWQTNLDNQFNNSVVAADAPIEVLNVKEEPSAWSDDIPKVDDRQETIHNVPTIDDWSMMPTNNPEASTELPEIQLDNPNKTEANEEMFPDIKPGDLEPSQLVGEPEINNSASSDSDIWKA